MKKFNIGDILTTLRIGAGIKQKEICDKFNLKQSTYSSWERGSHEPSASMFLNICDYYGSNPAIKLIFKDSNLVDLDPGASELLEMYFNLPGDIKENLLEIVKSLERSLKS